MILIALIVVLIGLDRIVSPILPINQSWPVALGLMYLFASISMQGWFISAKHENILFRSILALLCIYFWSEWIVYLVWNFSGSRLDITPYAFLALCNWLLYILKREYEIVSHKFNPDNVNILLLKPRSSLEVIKAFLGAPVASVCVAIGGYVWSFRHKSGKFERMPFNNEWLNNHIIIDTGVPSSFRVLDALDKVIGEKRGSCIKCVWSIRHALNLLGNKYAIKSWLHYVPGIYALRIIR